jgi:hypothetical protein
MMTVNQRVAGSSPAGGANSGPDGFAIFILKCWSGNRYMFNNFIVVDI